MNKIRLGLILHPSCHPSGIFFFRFHGCSWDFWSINGIIRYRKVNSCGKKHLSIWPVHAKFIHIYFNKNLMFSTLIYTLHGFYHVVFVQKCIFFNSGVTAGRMSIFFRVGERKPKPMRSSKSTMRKPEPEWLGQLRRPSWRNVGEKCWVTRGLLTMFSL